MESEYSETVKRRARKPHRCDDCFSIIEPRSVYFNTRGVTCGSWWGWKRCSQCQALYDLMLADNAAPAGLDLEEYVTCYHTEEQIEQDGVLSGFISKKSQHNKHKEM